MKQSLRHKKITELVKQKGYFEYRGISYFVESESSNHSS